MTAHDETKNGNDWYLPEDSRKYLKNLFADLKDPVTLAVFTRDGENDAYNEAMTAFVRDLDRLGDKITAEFNTIGDEKSGRYGVTSSPTLLLNPDTHNIRYLGTPLGEEARAFIETIVLISHGASGLSDQSKALLAELDEPREAMVFMNPDCPYCPGQVSNAFKAAIERPDMVSAIAVETNENPDLADEYSATSLPTTVINKEFTSRGLQPEERFIVELMTMKEADQALADQPEAPSEAGPKAKRVDAVIVGGGPAGMTAAIYLERSGLKTLVLEKTMVGGQVNLTPEVENYPGFKKVGGIQLMEMISEHARNYGEISEGEEVEEIRVGRDIEVVSSKGRYICQGLILATGARSRMLGVPGEETFYGRGVSVCASCDGWAFKGKEVVMIGGGNTALTEALHLHNLGVKVTLVHRRDVLRAEKRLQESLDKAGIPIVWNTEVEEFMGKDGLLTGVTLKDNATGETKDMAVDGAFLAIGWLPNSQLARELGVKTDEYGYIEVDKSMRTNIPRIYACGDVIGGVQQIVTAVGEGSTAALSLFEDISNPYWKQPGD